MNEQLGNLIADAEGVERDAIHIAIAPVVAAAKLAPGQDVGFCDDSLKKVGISDNPVGIIDPFLKQMVFPGQWCYMLLYPNTITGLRHEWTHPAFENPQTARVEDAKKWLEEFAEELEMSYGAMMEAVRNHIDIGEYHTLRFDLPDIVFDGRNKFWQCWEIVTGEVVEDREAPLGFTCAC